MCPDLLVVRLWYDIWSSQRVIGGSVKCHFWDREFNCGLRAFGALFSSVIITSNIANSGCSISLSSQTWASWSISFQSAQNGYVVWASISFCCFKTLKFWSFYYWRITQPTLTNSKNSIWEGKMFGVFGWGLSDRKTFVKGKKDENSCCAVIKPLLFTSLAKTWKADHVLNEYIPLR